MKKTLLFITIALSTIYSCTSEDVPSNSKESSYDDAIKDLPFDNAIDLSASGASNCYIITKAGLYKFQTLKGNSSEQINLIDHAEIIWESFGNDTPPKKRDLIYNICFKDNHIIFETPSILKKGNALVAVKDSYDEILWSWHIWFTDQPEEQFYSSTEIMMDRNLGATSTEVDNILSFGLLYQHDRKDPFLWYGDFPYYDRAKKAQSTTGSWDTVDSGWDTGSIQYSITHPTHIISDNTRNSHWMFTGDSSKPKLWTSCNEPKSIYDPCPSGWRIPDKEVIFDFLKENDKSSFDPYTGEYKKIIDKYDGYRYGLILQPTENTRIMYPFRSRTSYLTSDFECCWLFDNVSGGILNISYFVPLTDWPQRDYNCYGGCRTIGLIRCVKEQN